MPLKFLCNFFCSQSEQRTLATLSVFMRNETEEESLKDTKAKASKKFMANTKVKHMKQNTKLQKCKRRVHTHAHTHTQSHTYSRICVGIKGWVVFMSGKYVSGSALIRFMTEPRSSVTVCVRLQLCLCVCCRHIVEQLFFNFCLVIFLMAAFFKMNGFVHKFSLYA